VNSLPAFSAQIPAELSELSLASSMAYARHLGISRSGTGDSELPPAENAAASSAESRLAAELFAIFDSDRDSVLKGDDFKRFATGFKWDDKAFPGDERREDFATMSEREYEQALSEFGVQDFSNGLSLSEFLAAWSSVRMRVSFPHSIF
jgi:hypothetical protein